MWQIYAYSYEYISPSILAKACFYIYFFNVLNPMMAKNKPQLSANYTILGTYPSDKDIGRETMKFDTG